MNKFIKHYCYGICPKPEFDKEAYLKSQVKGVCHPANTKPKCYCKDKSGSDEWILKNPCCVPYEKWEAHLYKCCGEITMDFNIKKVICDIVINADITKPNCGITTNSKIDVQKCDLLLKGKLDIANCGLTIDDKINNKTKING